MFDRARQDWRRVKDQRLDETHVMTWTIGWFMGIGFGIMVMAVAMR